MTKYHSRPMQFSGEATSSDFRHGQPLSGYDAWLKNPGVRSCGKQYQARKTGWKAILVHGAPAIYTLQAVFSK